MFDLQCTTLTISFLRIHGSWFKVDFARSAPEIELPMDSPDVPGQVASIVVKFATIRTPFVLASWTLSFLDRLGLLGNILGDLGQLRLEILLD